MQKAPLFYHQNIQFPQKLWFFYIEIWHQSHLLPYLQRVIIDSSRFIGVYEGGIPEFNSDKTIDTPTFVSKSEVQNYLLRNLTVNLTTTSYIDRGLDKILRKLLILRLRMRGISVLGRVLNGGSIE
jgi:hypothetical protein